MTAGLTIVIPTYNRCHELGPTLDSVAAVRIPAGCQVEVLVIDNNCTDDRGRMMCKRRLATTGADWEELGA